ncbi:Guanylate-binding protein N-terminal domain-containing protein [Entamoeba marina]
MSLIFEEESLDFIRPMSTVIPVTVIGPRKSGKSFLLNSLSKTNAFVVGHSSYPESEGIKVMNKKITNNNVLYFDTEGLSSNPAGYDKNVVLFGVLSSSQLIINVKNEILFSDIMSLSVIAQLAEYYRHHRIEAFKFPVLTWVIEDYNKEIDVEPEQLLYNHFLKLKANPQNNELIEDYNQIITVLKDLFPIQKLFLLPEPIDDIYQFTNLDNIEFNKLSKRYRNQIDNLLQWITKYANYIQNVVSEVMNEEINPISMRVVEHFGDNIIVESFELYQNQMESIQLPTETHSLLKTSHKFANESLIYFDTLMNGFDTTISSNKLRTLLLNKIENALNLNLLKNEKESHTYNNQIMEESLSMIEGQPTSGISSLKQTIVDHYDRYAIGPTKNYYHKLLVNQLNMITTEIHWNVLVASLLCIFTSFLLRRILGLSVFKSLTICIFIFISLWVVISIVVYNNTIFQLAGTIFYAFINVTQQQILVIATSLCCFVVFSLI